MSVDLKNLELELKNQQSLLQTYSNQLDLARTKYERTYGAVMALQQLISFYFPAAQSQAAEKTEPVSKPPKRSDPV